MTLALRRGPRRTRGPMKEMLALDQPPGDTKLTPRVATDRRFEYSAP